MEASVPDEPSLELLSVLPFASVSSVFSVLSLSGIHPALLAYLCQLRRQRQFIWILMACRQGKDVKLFSEIGVYIYNMLLRSKKNQFCLLCSFYNYLNTYLEGLFAQDVPPGWSLQRTPSYQSLCQVSFILHKKKLQLVKLLHYICQE